MCTLKFNFFFIYTIELMQVIKLKKLIISKRVYSNIHIHIL